MDSESQVSLCWKNKLQIQKDLGNEPSSAGLQLLLLLSVTQSCSTFRDLMKAVGQASLSFTTSRSLLKVMSIELVMPSDHLLLCHPLLLLPSIFPSIRVFSNESALHIRWPKYWSFSISPSN